MKYKKQIQYNTKTANKYDWNPSWFGCNEFDDKLIEHIIFWQKQHGLKTDGLVGPSTYRRIWTQRESNISVYKPKNTSSNKTSNIVHNGNFIPINWDKVVLWNEDGGFKAVKNSYSNLSGTADRKPTMFVNHWDVCLTSESCARVLNKRRVSIHFLIDNDGTIYQMLDTQHKAWHAGIKNGVGGNRKGIGVEIANAYYLKYQDWYIKNGFGERPIVSDATVHGRKIEPFLDFYPIQIKALMALWEAVHNELGIPYQYPSNSNGALTTGVHDDCVKGTFKGFCNHYNFTETKIDCANLNIKTLLEKLND